MYLGVYASARCCNISVNSCTNKMSHWSKHGDGDSVSATCDEGDTLFGCATHTTQRQMDGIYPGAQVLDNIENVAKLLQTDNKCTAVNGRGNYKGVKGK